MKPTVRRSLLTVTLAIALAMWLAPTPALAGKHDKITAVVNGHRVRFHGKLVCDAYNQGDMSGVFSVTAGQLPHRLGQLVRTIVVTCEIDLAGGTPPLSCSIGYSEVKLARSPIYRQFGGNLPDVQVTFTSYDGTSVKGTFSGTLAPLAGATSAATVTKGSFSLLLGQDACTNPG